MTTRSQAAAILPKEAQKEYISRIFDELEK